MLFVALLLGSAASAAGQDPRPDTTVVPVDTAAADTAAAPADTAAPVVVLPDFPSPPGTGWAAGVWVWDREDLLNSTAFSLTDLLQRIPGLTPVRSGLFAFPEAVAFYGATAGRVEVVLDGYVLDPLTEPSLDLASIELAELREVRVERRLGVLRIELRTLRPVEPDPYSLVEAGSGDLETNLFRGVFLAPRLLGGNVGLAFDRLATEGFGGREDASRTTYWAAYGLARGERGVRVELRRGSAERGRDVLFAGEGERTDVIARVRGRFFDRLTAELFAGRAWVEDAFVLPGVPLDTLDGDSIAAPTVEADATQLGLRALYEHGALRGGLAARRRDADGLPSLDLRLHAGARLGDRLVLLADLEWADWEGETALALGARATADLFLGLRAFGEVERGQRGVPLLRDTAEAPVLTERGALRLGLQLTRGAFFVGAAAVLLDSADVPSFGLPFDRTVRRFAAEEAQGLELSARLPLLWSPLSLRGWYGYWPELRGAVYFPAQSWRAELGYDHSPLESGNLEIHSALIARRRGAMLVPDQQSSTVLVPGVTLVDFELMIRVIDVRAFLRWENLLNERETFDLPGRVFPGQRVLYGVKWQFRN